MKIDKVFILGVIFALTLGSAGLVFAHNDNYDQCNANNEENCPDPVVICDNGEHTGNPHCITPTPTEEISPTITPEVSPSVTETPEASPTAEVTVEPTTPPSDHGDGLSDGKSDGRSDGRSSTPQVTLTPCSVPNTCGMK